MSDSESYDAVVYDLDGTLVRLDVDWAALASELDEVMAAVGADVDGASVWELLDAAEAAGVGGRVHERIAARERDGAARSTRLPLADDLAATPVPVAVCSLNAESACHTALAAHDLSAHVDCVVGRDTLDARKPDPEPLRYALDRLGVAPERALFVGDSDSDERAAHAAGMAFRRV